ncbi:MAG: glycosyltransferase family 2 protein [SAR324 cluster bacterium]|nr:glycosyltransferase family 2 protein [SAR324 cluster bacterium]
MITISAVILTKNEEMNIVRCINSLQWCNEVVVLDSQSNDQTVALAKSLGARVFIHTQLPPFRISEQRNWALENCDLQGEWIFFVDADEVVPQRLSDEIQQICSQKDNRYNAFELTPRYFFWGKWLKRTQGYPNWHARLLKRGEVSFTGGVWEHFAPGAKIGKINIPYDHFSNSKGLSDWLERHNRYSSWDAERILEFLETKKFEDLGTSRKLKLRSLSYRFWLFRPFARFFQMYVLRLGFLEGWNSLVLCFMYFVYELMVVIKVIELKRKQTGLGL